MRVTSSFDELARDQEGRFLDDLVDLQQILLGRRLLQESPDAGHDLAGAAALSDDVTDRRRNLLQIGHVAAQPPQASLAAGDDRCQRLIHLVGNGRAELAEGSDARGMRQLRLRREQRILCLLALGDVDDEGEHVAIAVGLGRKGDRKQDGNLASVETHELGLAFVEPLAFRECDQCAEETAVVLVQKPVHVLDEGRGSRLLPPSFAGPD